MASSDTVGKRSGGALAFFKHEAAGGIVMLLAAALALVVSNTALSGQYTTFLETHLSFKFGEVGLDKPLLHWINDGLMAIFFCLVGLEIKRELIEGELSTREQALLPALAALGGMVGPALIYAAVNWNNPAALGGWAIPAATDIAFAVTVLTLVGPSVPPALKIFLLALAIIDDLGAIIIIALFYTAKLSGLALGLAAVGVAALVAFNWLGVRSLAFYILAGIFLWVCVLKSGIHATLAGVVVGLSIPMTRTGADDQSLLERMEHGLHPWVAFGVLPLFGFANAGVPLTGLSWSDLAHPVTLGIAFGLILGKPIGILGAVWLSARAGIAGLPAGTTWTHVLGAGLLAGIGFTMSLFIGILAFDGPEYAKAVRLGVLVASLVAAVAGFLVLARAGKAPQPTERSEA